MIVNGSNWSCNNIAACYIKVEDDSMSAIFYKMESKGNLSNMSYILRNPDTHCREGSISPSIII